MSTLDRRLADPKVFSFALVSYDQRHVYENIPFRVQRVDTPAENATATYRNGYTLHVRLRFPDAQPGLYTLYLRSPYPTADSWQAGIPVSVPDRSAAHLRDLRRRYTGRLAWTYGELTLRSGDQVPHVSDGIVNVKGVVRIARIDRAPGIKIKMNDYTSNRGLIYEAVDPLIVHVRIDKSEITGAGWRGGDERKQAAIATAVEGSKELVFMVSDAWDLERTVALHPPDIDLSKHPNLVGLTHEEVAFSVGFPSIAGSRAELLRMRRWSYPYTAPNQFSVEFRGDRAVHDDPPGDLP